MLGETILNHIDNSSAHITESERNAWNNKSDFSGVYDDLVNAPNILENGSGELDITDESGNIILKVDKDGLKTTTVTTGQVVVDGKDILTTIDSHVSDKTVHVTKTEKETWDNKSDFSGAYEDLEGKPDIINDESGSMIIADESGNIIMQVDSDGLKTTTVTAEKIVADGKDVLSTIDNHISDDIAHVTKEERETWDNKSDFSGVYDDLINAPSISNDNSGTLNIADESGNVILKVDANGLETTSVTAQDVTIDGINVKTKFEELKGDINGVSSTLDSHASDTNIHIDSTEREKWNKDIENLEAHKNDEIKHITSEERSTWNNKSDFSGNYNDLIDAPNITDDDTGVLNIADESGNVILKVDKDGLETTAVTTNKVILNGINVEVELKGLGDKFDNLDSDLDSHTSDTNIHITVDERNIWNAKATTDYVDQKVAGVVNSAPETLDTLNELATALGNDENFATTVTNSLAEKATRVELNTHANNTDIHIIDSERDKWDKNIVDLDTHVNDDVKHITSDERNTWNNKSDFSGNYNDLVDAPDISDNDETGELNIVDKSGNIIVRVSKNGLETTTVVAQKVEVSGTDVESKLSEFDNHVSDVTDSDGNNICNVPHVKDIERSKWNGYESTISGNASEISKLSSLVGTESVEKQISDAIEAENLSQYAKASDLSSHTSDITTNTQETYSNPHVKDSERTAWGNKVDKETGKGLSTNDFTDAYKTKLDNIENEANKIIVDTTLSDTSENPVQNKAVSEAINELRNNKVDKVAGSRLITESEVTKLNSLTLGEGGQVEINGKVDASNVEGLDELLVGKVDTETGKGLSTNDYTTAEKEKLAGIAEGATAFSGSYTDLTNAPSILEDKTGKLEIADEAENVILRVDSNGLETTTVTAEKVVANTIEINEFEDSIENIIKTYILNVDYSKLEFDKTEIVVGEGVL